MSRKELIDITVRVHAQTEKAVLVSENGDRDDAVWLPLSQIEMEDKGQPGVVEITLPEWLAVDKGLI